MSNKRDTCTRQASLRLVSKGGELEFGEKAEPVLECVPRLNEAQQRLKVATTNTQTAGETYQLIKRQYEGGSAGITRYLEAELAYSRARIRETSAYFDRQKAHAQIARAIGYWSSRR